MEVNILISGVGGQGIILASDIIGYAAVLEGYKVTGSEVHGMAQRGGSVVTHLRFGNEIYSPLIEKGRCDYLLAFEPLEALRYLDYCNKNTIAIVNTEPIPPTTARKIGSYPSVEKIIEILEDNIKVIAENYTQKARELGTALVANVMMIGTLSALERFPIKKESFIEAIKSVVPRKIDLNLKAFEVGRNIS